MAKELNEYTKEELIEYIQELKKQLSSEKYGLYWDRSIDKEEVIRQCETNIPILERERERTILDCNGEDNILIEGDNFHALTALNMIAPESIDVIYIDPPYNTGHEDFVYNDKFVNSDDGYVHSKWLSFMDKRLRLAKSLLKEDGVIFISIDDNEQANLKLLCDQIFGLSNFYGEMIQLKGNTQNDSKSIQKNHEYVLCYAKNNKPLLLTYCNDVRKEVFDDEFYLGRDTGASSGHDTLIERANLGYTIYYFESTGNGVTGNHNTLIERANLLNNKYGEFNFYFNKKGDKFIHAIAIADYDKSKVKPDSKEEDVYDDVQELISLGYKPIRPPKRKGGKLGRWTWGLEGFKSYWNNNEVLIKNYKNVIKKEFVNEKEITEINGKKYYVKFNTLPLKSIIDITNSAGTTTLKGNNGILPGIAFNNPKSVELLIYLVRSFTRNDCYVLDFFAGSGTTGQAVMELNKEDGGHRKFILCTNNENNICRDVTYPRLKTCITGIRSDGSKYSDGLTGNNLIYYKTSFVKDENNTEQAKYSLVEKVDELLCIKEGIFVEVSRNDYSSYYKSSDGKRHMFIYNDYYSPEKMEKFKEEIRNAEGSKIIYVYASDNSIDETLFKGFKDIEVKPIPSKIYEIYKEIVENIKRGE